MKKLIMGTLLATSVLATAYAANNESSGVDAILLLQKLDSGASIVVSAPSTNALQRQLGASEVKQSVAQSQIFVVSFDGKVAQNMIKQHAVTQALKQKKLYCTLSKNIGRQASAYVCALDEQTVSDNSERS